MRKRMLLAETRRLVASRLFIILISSFVALEILAGLVSAVVANKAIHEGTSTADLSFLNFISSSGMTRMFVTILGIVLITKEFASGSILRNSINAGSPARLYTVKLIVSMFSGAIFALVYIAVAISGALIWVSREHFELNLSGHLVQICARPLLATILAGPLGVTIGWFGKREKPTVWIYLAYEMVLVSALIALLPAVYKWLPDGAGSAITNASGVGHFGFLAGMALYLAWLAALGAGGNTLMKKRGLA